MLSVNPKMLPRLDELEQDLIARLRRARDENWRGEIEGLELTLTFEANEHRPPGWPSRVADTPISVCPDRRRSNDFEAVVERLMARHRTAPVPS
ncbi:hypothetical protein [Nocardia abscessus]|uniref:hypothetical protein n=1 Tax=Nocardia abscessus TaxID=120957 RepID=UPI00030F33E2|nr:hypothetical protein [Nocardia abscessus]MCC3332033.1 hypothetical protein [Nocardia abscessus]